MKTVEQVVEGLKRAEWIVPTKGLISNLDEDSGDYIVAVAALDDVDMAALTGYNDEGIHHIDAAADLMEKWFGEHGIVCRDKCCIWSYMTTAELQFDSIEELLAFAKSSGIKLVPDEEFAKFRDNVNRIEKLFRSGKKTSEENAGLGSLLWKDE